jgi:hypothetical protein
MGFSPGASRGGFHHRAGQGNDGGLPAFGLRLEVRGVSGIDANELCCGLGSHEVFFLSVVLGDGRNAVANAFNSAASNATLFQISPSRFMLASASSTSAIARSNGMICFFMALNSIRQ